MVAVFAIFATLSQVSIKQAGVGLGVAVLVDATIVRTVLLPGDDDHARRAQLVPPPGSGAGLDDLSVPANRSLRELVLDDLAERVPGQAVDEVHERAGA